MFSRVTAERVNRLWTWTSQLSGNHEGLIVKKKKGWLFTTKAKIWCDSIHFDNFIFYRTFLSPTYWVAGHQNRSFLISMLIKYTNLMKYERIGFRVSLCGKALELQLEWKWNKNWILWHGLTGSGLLWLQIGQDRTCQNQDWSQQMLDHCKYPTWFPKCLYPDSFNMHFFRMSFVSMVVSPVLMRYL